MGAAVQSPFWWRIRTFIVGLEIYPGGHVPTPRIPQLVYAWNTPTLTSHGIQTLCNIRVASMHLDSESNVLGGLRARLESRKDLHNRVMSGMRTSLFAAAKHCSEQVNLEVCNHIFHKATAQRH